MGQEDARRGGVYWLVEPLDGKRLHRRVQSTHHLGADALATTHRLSCITLTAETSTTSCGSTAAVFLAEVCFRTRRDDKLSGNALL